MRENKVSLLESRKAYLQVYIYKLFWTFHIVLLRGCRYRLTRLAYGLNVASIITQSIIDVVLSQDELIKHATSTCNVDGSLVSTKQVRNQFTNFGHSRKDPERLKDGAKI